ncbi:hypothetical protein CPB83DRAFT_841530 [Crepidotus variabilis]|uniref:Uncharacterized protein n=1 Tax=Crepidotus variabilis TaxID=179855 RepID=A0A9P6JWN4_9AGAR|nr:hypothetical protein CPB83DRAFT_841530 [Crepidotus variabilis]
MRFAKSFLAVVALFSAVGGANAVSFPPLLYLGTININITAGQQIPVYEGTRVTNSYLGGYATDKDGNTVAHIVPGEGGEGGLTNAKGLFHPSVRGVLQFDNDGSYGFFTMEGIKNGTEFLYVNFGTNSTKYDYLNKLFIISNATKTADNVLHFDLFSPGPGLPL